MPEYRPIPRLECHRLRPASQDCLSPFSKTNWCKQSAYRGRMFSIIVLLLFAQRAVVGQATNADSPESAIQVIASSSRKGDPGAYYNECIPLFSSPGGEIAFLEQRRAEHHRLLNQTLEKQIGAQPIPFDGQVVRQFLGERVSQLELIRSKLADSKQIRVTGVEKIDCPVDSILGYYDEPAPVSACAKVQVEVTTGGSEAHSMDLFAFRIAGRWRVVDRVGWMALSLPDPGVVVNTLDDTISKLRAVNDGYRDIVRKVNRGELGDRSEVVRLVESLYARAGWRNQEPEWNGRSKTRPQENEAAESLILTLSSNGRVQFADREMSIKECGELLANLKKLGDARPALIVRFRRQPDKQSIESLLSVIIDSYDVTATQFAFPDVGAADAFLHGLTGRYGVFAKSEILIEREQP